jgi:hypothetical protein
MEIAAGLLVEFSCDAVELPAQPASKNTFTTSAPMNPGFI